MTVQPGLGQTWSEPKLLGFSCTSSYRCVHSFRESKPADVSTEIRPVGKNKTGLILACVLVIFFAAFYAIAKTVSDLSSQLDALQRDNANLDFHVKALGEKMFALQMLLESQSKDTEIVAFSARIKPSYTDIKPGSTIVFADVETNVGNSYSGTSGG